MELRQLRYFVTVAETLHFGRAAELLHIVQPAVSQQIRRLERELGAQLFDRSPRRVRITAFGERFLPAAREVLAAADRALALAHPDRRTIRLGTSTGLGERLDQVLEQLSQAAPDVAVELVSAPVGERLAQVAEGRLDAAFVRGAARHPGLRTVALWTDPLVAVVSARGPLAAAASLDLADLAGMRLTLTARRNHPALVDLVTGACAAAGFEPRPGPPAGTLQDTLAAIGADETLWTVAYAAHTRTLRAGRVAFVPFRDPGLSLVTSLAVRDGDPDPVIAALVGA
ncbi:LysR family transcriptional regulator [Dactylosporangium sp. NPDC051485]|uniref:LysR substrate-binding domain-containing protein n=1 Tax=Dactylosporangium sp. NPDC051485 TaxID=3154846 RepID=UPI003417D623